MLSFIKILFISLIYLNITDCNFSNNDKYINKNCNLLTYQKTNEKNLYDCFNNNTQYCKKYDNYKCYNELRLICIKNNKLSYSISFIVSLIVWLIIVIIN